MTIVSIEPISKGHIARLHELLQDPTIGQTQQMPTPCSLSWVSTYVHERALQMQSGTRATYVIKADGVIIGSIGMSISFEDNLKVGHWGFWIEKGYRGNGYATEAGRLTLAEVFDNLKLNRVDSDCLERNHVSVKIHRKLGFVETGRSHLRGSRWPNDLFIFWQKTREAE